MRAHCLKTQRPLFYVDVISRGSNELHFVRQYGSIYSASLKFMIRFIISEQNASLHKKAHAKLQRPVKPFVEETVHQ
jgi:hypothetical protein